MPKTVEELEEKVLPLAITAGAGMPIETLTAHCGVATQTYYNRLEDPDAKTYFDHWKAFTAAAVEKEVERRVRKIESAQSNEAKIGAIFTRALALTEKALEKAEKLGDEATLDGLVEIHSKITVWASKFAASEAPKRVEIGGKVQHVHVLVDDTVNRISAFAEKYDSLNMLPPANAEEAHVVS